MKILQVNVVYGRGSTGKITADIHKELRKKGHESIVCTSRLTQSEDINVINLCGINYSRINAIINRITGFLYGGCLLSTKKLISIIKKEKPEVVHLQCINGNFINIYKLLSWLKLNNIRTVLTLHAEFMYTGGCSYVVDCEKWKSGCEKCDRYKTEMKSIFFDRSHEAWIELKKSVENFKYLTIVPVSYWIAEQVSKSPIYRNFPIKVIHNGIDTECFENCKTSDIINLKKKYGIPLDKKIVLHVTPNFFSDEKGGEYFYKLVEILPNEYQAIVVGYKGNKMNKLIGIKFLENQKELAIFYSMADVFVITSKIDNYPTVCIEANCCGTPVVGFDVGGVKETIGNGMGEVIPAFNIKKMLEKIIYWSNHKINISNELKQTRIEYCKKERMVRDYLNLYRDILSKNN